ncbi:hypothetical protein BT96DRAFT_990071 [Gymnopus androsaceus JB14]|uniref:Uncharacterized protein n=1 Tax=Gymnopus androsaceus JB14 TaxID=1447944 RepID=A0A6A4I100_9AGAR|nr:hypothetical protein BT96DRAFT_990071 [Gymnopus androsaceus JB14]
MFTVSGKYSEELSDNYAPPDLNYFQSPPHNSSNQPKLVPFSEFKYPPSPPLHELAWREGPIIPDKTPSLKMLKEVGDELGLGDPSYGNKMYTYNSSFTRIIPAAWTCITSDTSKFSLCAMRQFLRKCAFPVDVEAGSTLTLNSFGPMLAVAIMGAGLLGIWLEATKATKWESPPKPTIRQIQLLHLHL